MESSSRRDRSYGAFLKAWKPEELEEMFEKEEDLEVIQIVYAYSQEIDYLKSPVVRVEETSY